MQVGAFEFVFGLKHNLSARAYKHGAVCLALARDVFQGIARLYHSDMNKVFRNGMKEHKVKGAATIKSRMSQNSARSHSSKKSNGSRASKASRASRASRASKASHKSGNSVESKTNTTGTKDTKQSKNVRCLASAAVFCLTCKISVYSLRLSAHNTS
jgi:cobalamin biosynthesis Mg chelatase CobN